jgi:uridine phosphorylase
MALKEVNPHLAELNPDFLYHLGLTSADDLKGLFGDTKFVCMGGSGMRAEKVATKFSKQLRLPIIRYSQNPESDINDVEGVSKAIDEITEGKKGIRPTMGKVYDFVARQANLPTAIGKTERFELFKVGPVVIVSHGMGMPSMQIALDEVTKMLHYAGAEDFKYFRIGTSGGVGIEGGDVVIADEAVNDSLETVHEKTELGSKKRYPTQLDAKLAQELLDVAEDINVQVGKTMATDDFYLGQGRMDGFFEPGYTMEEHFAFLQRAHEAGVRNIEMEATAFAAFCLRAGIPATIICCALVDRLKGDQITSTPDELAAFADNAETVVIRYVGKQLGIAPREVE